MTLRNGDNMKKIFLFCSVMFTFGTFISIIQKMEISATICYIVIAIVFFILYLCTKKPQPKEKPIKDFHIKLSHLIGLDFPEDTKVLITYSKDKVNFLANKVNFSLPLERIKDLSIKKSSEIHQQYISSVGGATAGALLFGGLGAVIGGRAKKKTITEVTYCFIITYLKDNEMKYISFEIKNNFEYNESNKLVKLFKKENNIENTTFEL